MALTLAEIETAIDDLYRARADGTRLVRDANGHEIQYRSDAEMAQAIRDLQALLASQSGNQVHTIVFRGSKGL